MGIDFELANFPQLNQNKEPANPYPDVNAGMDCVPTSIAAALTWFTGTPYYGNEIIDQVSAYGPTYHGGTAADAYEDYCAARGVKLSPVDGDPAQLVADLHTLVHQQKPTLVTIPGQWNSPNTSGANPGDVTHVCCVYGDGPGLLRMMNPWIAPTPHDVTDEWLIDKLCYGQIWPMERAIMQLSQVTDFFEDAGNGLWRCKQTGYSVGYGLLAAYQSWPANGSLNGLTALGLPLSNEIQVPNAPAGVVYQQFERGVLVWDPDRHYDSPPGAAGGVYAAHLTLVQPPAQPPAAPEWASAILAMEVQLKALLEKANAPVSGGAEPAPDPTLVAAQQEIARLQARLERKEAKLTDAYNAAHAIYTLIEQRFVIQEEQQTGPTVAVQAVRAPESAPEPAPASAEPPAQPTLEPAPERAPQPAEDAPDPSPEEILAAQPAEVQPASVADAAPAEHPAPVPSDSQPQPEPPPADTSQAA